jgi:hypothetical protein
MGSEQSADITVTIAQTPTDVRMTPNSIGGGRRV